jgi:hypothetical protein
MPKSKQPRKRKEPAKAELVPPALPPAPSPERQPVVSEHREPALAEFTGAIRRVVGAMLDLADTAADLITRRLTGRA